MFFNYLLGSGSNCYNSLSTSHTISISFSFLIPLRPIPTKIYYKGIEIERGRNKDQPKYQRAKSTTPTKAKAQGRYPQCQRPKRSLKPKCAKCQLSCSVGGASLCSALSAVECTAHCTLL